MNKCLGYRPQRATGPRGLRYRRSIHAKSFRSKELALEVSSILQHMSGDPCDVVPSSPGRWFVLRAAGDGWVKA